jgi:gamma-glutamyl:cysteine ligase YbdK (ATP-grasp superfamily)
VVEDGRHLYWDVRPSSRWPTLEFRLADVCTDLDAAVLHAALVRSLVRVLADRDGPVPEVRPELLRAARWRAARDGLGGELFDPVRGEPVGAREAVGALVAELADDLRAHGEEGRRRRDARPAVAARHLGRPTAGHLVATPRPARGGRPDRAGRRGRSRVTGGSPG